jgi:pyruvate dehydrogenase E2 component (dihydrolipoamide acetyltransferase)
MAIILRMPEILANTTHAVLDNWLVEEGQEVKTGDVLAEVETEKALVELNAEDDGVVYRRLIAPGEDVEVGSPIAVLSSPGETGVDLDALLGGELPAAAHAQAVAPATTAGLNGQPPAEPEPTNNVPQQPDGSADSAQRLFASPIVRRMARERNLDLTILTGTGPNGRIVRRDVEAYFASESAKAEPDVLPAQPIARPEPAGLPTGSVPEYVEIPHSRMRQAIARRLTESKNTVPHFYLTADCRVDPLLRLRNQINEGRDRKISVNDFVAKAVAAAFADVPEANVTWTDTALRQYTHTDISIAVATDGGLVTPVLRNVETRTLSDVSSTIAELVSRARNGRFRQHELEGGSFSVTNLGMFGTQEFSAILNPPQSGILAVGAVQQRPLIENGAVAVGMVMRCTLSVDHRAIDGVLAARWLAAFQTRIEYPLSTLI